MTAVFNDSFKGHPILAIWEVDSYGNRKGTKPIVSFGKTKANAILNNIGAIETWMEQQSPSVANFQKVQVKPLEPAVVQVAQPQQVQAEPLGPAVVQAKQVQVQHEDRAPIVKLNLAGMDPAKQAQLMTLLGNLSN